MILCVTHTTGKKELIALTGPLHVREAKATMARLVDSTGREYFFSADGTYDGWGQSAAPLPPVPAADKEQDFKALYFELLYAVASKYPNESRHATALRYIQRGEERTSQAYAASPVPAEPPPDLERVAAFCEQTAKDGIMPSLAWFAETSAALRASRSASDKENK